MTFAFFSSDDPATEAYGLRLVNMVSAQLRAAFDLPRSTYVPLGPDFVYEDGPRLFLGRRGRGPLHVAWDTNLLIDYFQHGRMLWQRASMPEFSSSYGDQLEALQIIFALWVVRDIRFHLPSRILVDAKRQLSGRNVSERRMALDAFSSALSLVESGEGELDVATHDGLLVPPDGELQHALGRVPSTDRHLVSEAVRMGAHVFLTRDKGVIRAGEFLRPFGILLATPGDVLTELMACGAFHCLWAPEFAYWPLPDQARVTHLIHALPLPDDAEPTEQRAGEHRA